MNYTLIRFHSSTGLLNKSYEDVQSDVYSVAYPTNLSIFEFGYMYHTLRLYFAFSQEIQLYQSLHYDIHSNYRPSLSPPNWNQQKLMHFHNPVPTHYI